MLHIHLPADLALPELAPFQTLRRRKDMERLDRFVVEGEKCVRRLLASRLPCVIESLLLTPAWLEALRAELEGRPETIHAYLADHRAIEAFTGFRVNQDVKVLARALQRHTLQSVSAAAGRPWLFVAADGLNNAENMGTLVRNAAAFGAHALLVGETSTCPLLTRTIRTSMGTVFELPFAHVPDLAEALAELKARGARIVGAHAHTRQRRIGQLDLCRDVCLVFGNEGSGLSSRVEAVCDDLAVIPIAPHVDSLNVGSAVAVFLYETARQRGLIK